MADVDIITVEILDEDGLEDAWRRAGQVAGLLGFSEEEQSALAGEVRAVARSCLDSGERTDLQLLVHGEGGSQELVARFTMTAALAGRIDGDTGAPGTTPFARRLQLDSGGGPAALELAAALPFEMPGEAGAVFARVAGELARRSNPDSVFLEIGEQNRELFRSVRELAELNRELEGYAHTVSHDLKGPLTNIMLANRVLQEKIGGSLPLEEGPGTRKLLDLIQNNVDRSASLIDDLLALAEAGQVPSVITEVDVGEVVFGIVAERGPEIERRGASVEVESKMGVVRAGRPHVYQVFSNLIGNALKHNDNPSPAVRVSRTGPASEGRTIFEVRDNGSGIPEEDMESVFIPFFKGKTGETGIGLTTVQRIIDLYNGEIEVVNDGGACFRFSFGDISPES